MARRSTHFGRELWLKYEFGDKLPVCRYSRYSTPSTVVVILELLLFYLGFGTCKSRPSNFAMEMLSYTLLLYSNINNYPLLSLHILQNSYSRSFASLVLRQCQVSERYWAIGLLHFSRLSMPPSRYLDLPLIDRRFLSRPCSFSFWKITNNFHKVICNGRSVRRLSPATPRFSSWF